MYFILKGTVSLFIYKENTNTEIELEEIKKLQNFGEIDMCLNKRLIYNIKIKSRICEMLVLKKDDFLKLSVNHREHVEAFLNASVFKHLQFKTNHAHLLQFDMFEKKEQDEEYVPMQSIQEELEEAVTEEESKETESSGQKDVSNNKEEVFIKRTSAKIVSQPNSELSAKLKSMKKDKAHTETSIQEKNNFNSINPKTMISVKSEVAPTEFAKLKDNALNRNESVDFMKNKDTEYLDKRFDLDNESSVNLNSMNNVSLKDNFMVKSQKTTIVEPIKLDNATNTLNDSLEKSRISRANLSEQSDDERKSSQEKHKKSRNKSKKSLYISKLKDMVETIEMFDEKFQGDLKDLLSKVINTQDFKTKIEYLDTLTRKIEEIEEGNAETEKHSDSYFRSIDKGDGNNPNINKTVSKEYESDVPKKYSNANSYKSNLSSARANANNKPPPKSKNFSDYENNS